jgi:hypothetical protein
MPSISSWICRSRPPPGRPRTSSVNGLPKGALNITLDGINVQDNLLKSSDGFFNLRPVAHRRDLGSDDF